jgi:hypothetical protein
MRFSSSGWCGGTPNCGAAGAGVRLVVLLPCPDGAVLRCGGGTANCELRWCGWCGAATACGGDAVLRGPPGPRTFVRLSATEVWSCRGSQQLRTAGAGRILVAVPRRSSNRCHLASTKLGRAWDGSRRRGVRAEGAGERKTALQWGLPRHAAQKSWRDTGMEVHSTWPATPASKPTRTRNVVRRIRRSSSVLARLKNDKSYGHSGPARSAHRRRMTVRA